MPFGRTADDLVNFVEKNNAILLDILQRLHLDFFFINQFGGFLFSYQLQRLADFQFSLAGLLSAHILENSLELVGHFLHSRRCHDLYPQ